MRFKRRALKEDFIKRKKDHSRIYVLDGYVTDYEELNVRIDALNSNIKYGPSDMPPAYISQEEVDRDIQDNTIWFTDTQTCVFMASVDDLDLPI